MCIVFTMLYHIAFSSLLFPIEISVMKNCQIGANICALSYKAKLNINQTMPCYGMVFDHTSKMIG